jgi:hypothetical protein
MRVDLETAMAAVIASRDASERFAESPSDFGREFGLAPSEIAMLVEMGDDLTSLTSAFVAKRRSTLRWNARRTLELLGDEGERLLDDFVEENPQSERFRQDATAFGDFVIAETAERETRSAIDRIIAEMARFEQHRSNSFWDATATIGEDPRLAPHEKPQTVRLVAGANVGRFDYDMRLPYRRDVIPWELLPTDPCCLLFFHSRHQAVLRTLRLAPLDAEVVSALPAGVTVDVSSIRESAPDGVDVDHLLRTLSWEEAIEWP